GGNRSFVALDDALSDRETETQSGMRPSRGAAFGLTEPLEDVRQIRGSDTGARVGHRQHGVRPDAREPKRDPASRRRELHGVREEIDDDLAEAGLIPPDGTGRWIHGAFDLDAFGSRLTDAVDRGLDDGAQIHGSEIELQLAADDA